MKVLNKSVWKVSIFDNHTTYCLETHTHSHAKLQFSSSLIIKIYFTYTIGHISYTTKKKLFSDYLYFLFVDWANQMSAGQTGPLKVKIQKSQIFNFFH